MICSYSLLYKLFFLYLSIRSTRTTNYMAEDITDRNYVCGELSHYDYGQNMRVPWAALLYRRTETIADRTDAAVVINKFMVLLSANRFQRQGPLKIYDFSGYTVSVNISRIDDSHRIDRNLTVQTVKVSHIEIHPAYNAKPWQWVTNDIAMVYLETPLRFDSFVYPVCIPPSESLVKKFVASEIYSNSENTQPVFVSGWPRYGSPENLKLNLNINHHNVCENWWRDNNETSNAVYTDRFCANVSSENAHTTCIHRDSGVFGKYNDRFYLLGFVNNFFADDRICNTNARKFVCLLTESMLKFINNSAICGRNRDFACTNGDCIPFVSVCNNKTDCRDGSDEKNAICTIDKPGDGSLFSDNRIVVPVTIIFTTVVNIIISRIYTYISSSPSNENNSNYEPISHFQPNTPELFRISRDDFRIGPIIGAGNFGHVLAGRYSKLDNGRIETVVVAIKTCTRENQSSLLNELRILIHINTPQHNHNMLQLIGCSYEENGQLYILMELLNENLLTYLRIKEQEQEILIDDALNDISLRWCLQIAEGMDYLISEKRVLHRDLSARNILVDRDGDNVKIADFGMSIILPQNADCVTLQSGQRVPITHCAVEVFTNDPYSTKSDVWSFAVTLWEIFTLGQIDPYDGNTDESSIWNFIMEKKLRLPLDCSNNEPLNEIYQMMLTCWSEQPGERPTFAALKEFLNNFDLEY